MENYIEVIKTEMEKLDVNGAAIAKIKQEFMALKIAGVDDKKGLEEVHSARMYVKGKRIEIENKRKELKADSIAYGKAVDAEAHRLTVELEPIEAYLLEEENKVEAEKKRIKEEKERIEAEKTQKRVVTLLNLGAQFDMISSSYVLGEISCTAGAVKFFTEEAFDGIVVAFTEEAQKIAAAEEIEAKKRAEELAEQARLDAEKEAERQRLIAEENARLEEQKKRQAAEAAQLAADRKKLEDAQAEADLKAQKEREKIAEARRLFEEEKQKEEDRKREEAAREQAKKDLILKQEREKELLPDKEKIFLFLESISNVKIQGDLSSKESQEFATQMFGSLKIWLSSITEELERL